MACRDLFPRSHCIQRAFPFTTRSIRTVETERGEATLVLSGEEDIHRLPGGMPLIADSHGARFLIRGAAG
ncbi:MAG: DUF1854 domain-containing protein [Rhodocyclaceae bacterium]|nr:DUF1854 domain-containing protein [Rhodocyclaceae bacterium]